MNTKWIFAAGMRRGGSTVQYHLAREIAKLEGGHDAGWVVWQRFDEVFDEFDGKYPYVVLKCHAFIPGMATRMKPPIWNSRGYGLYIHRDIRDVMASLIRLYKSQGAGDALNNSNLEEDMRAIFLTEGRKWMTLPRVLRTRYEDILDVDGLAKECARIATHIGADVSWLECRAIALEHSMEQQRRRLPTGTNMYNGKYLLWRSHLFTGKNGTWKEELTGDQVNFCYGIEQIAHKELRRE